MCFMEILNLFYYVNTVRRTNSNLKKINTHIINLMLKFPKNLILETLFSLSLFLCWFYSMLLSYVIFISSSSVSLIYSNTPFRLNRFVKNLFASSEFIAWRKVEILKRKCKLFQSSLTGLLYFKFRRNDSLSSLD